jgi:H+/Cl- antiporter ClcA
MRFDSFVEIAVFILTPAAIAYSWFFYLKRMHRIEQTWRCRVTFVTLILISLVVLAWPVMFAMFPKADWGTGVGIDHQMAYIEWWHKVILRTCAAALILSLFSRPRLIFPLVVSCFGIATFWLTSTAP